MPTGRKFITENPSKSAFS